MERKLTAILAIDVVGYSRLIRTDEEGTLDALRSLRTELIEPKITEFRGRVVKLIGDGLLAEFASVVDAVKCSADVQHGIAEKNGGIAEDKRIVFRMGINLGDVVIDGDDIQGDGVNVAARLEALSDPGGICISSAVYEQVRDRLDLVFRDLGDQTVKNINRPVRVWKWSGLSSDPSTDHGSHSVQRQSRPPKSLSIAVLPFDNMSGDTDQEFFADGITEDIITNLSKLSELKVISRNSTFAYKGRAVDFKRVSSDLNVPFMVEGSVRKAGNRVRVTAQLVGAEDGTHIWAERYDREITDVFAVQDDIAQRIADALKVAIAPSEKTAMEKGRTINPDAYEYYLRGRNFIHSMTRSNLRRAEHFFAKAVELDPNYAAALTGLAECEAMIGHYYSDSTEHKHNALAYCRQALDLDPGLAEAHAAHGFVLAISNRLSEADAAFERALALDPNLYEAFWYNGLTSLIRGDFEKARSHFQSASSVRGDDLQSMMMVMTVGAKLANKKALVQSASHAFASADRHLKLNPDDLRAAYIGAIALVFLGETEKALKLANLAAEIGTEDSRNNYNIACTFSLLGAVEQALEQFGKAIKHGRPKSMIPWAETDPDLVNLRKDERFWELMDFWKSNQKSTDL